VDLVFADPPYHLSNGGTTCQGGRRVRVDKGAWDASRGVAQDHAFQTRWLSACRRVLKPSGTIWVSGTQHVIFSVGYAMQELGFHLLNTITWYSRTPPRTSRAGCSRTRRRSCSGRARSG
jgi:site-specific DNA-methyltransferase (adenine-specific)